MLKRFIKQLLGKQPVSLTWRLIFAILIGSLITLNLMVFLPLYVFPTQLENLSPELRQEVEEVLDNPKEFAALLERVQNTPEEFWRQIINIQVKSFFAPPVKAAAQSTVNPMESQKEPSMPMPMPEDKSDGNDAKKAETDPETPAEHAGIPNSTYEKLMFIITQQSQAVQVTNLRRTLEEINTLAEKVQAERLRGLLLSALISCVVSVGLAMLVARHIAKPIKDVTSATARLTAGDLSTRVMLRHASDLETMLLSQNFNHMATTLERQENERVTMIASIAHELRTPLAVMQARLSALEDGMLELNISEVCRLQRQTERLSHLINDLRTLSLFDAGKLTITRRRFDFAKMLGDIVEDFRQRNAKNSSNDKSSENKDVNFHLAAPPQPLWFTGDRERLEQLFSNLVDNAVQHNQACDLQIWIDAKVDTENIHVTVRDNGCGLSTKMLEHAFDRFYSSRKEAGGGLGLAIVATITNLHGGNVSTHNHPEGGAVFNVVLPLEAA